MFEIDVTGDIIPSQFDWFGGFSLNKLKEQLKLANGKDVQLNINSYGGDVNEGLAIYSRLRKYATENDATITTVTEGNCASIATVIFLAGDTRKLNKYIEPFVHNAWCYAEGDSKDIQKTADQLERVNEIIAKFYAEHTELTYTEARALMDADTFITPEEALEMRFCTELDEIIRPAALIRFNTKNNKMSENIAFTKEHETFLNKLSNFFKANPKPKNLMVRSAANDELDFPDAETEADIVVGLQVTVSDDTNATGDYLMNSGETYKVVEGKLDAIIPKEDELEAENSQLKETIEANATEIESLKNSLQNKDSKLLEATNLLKENEGILNQLKGISPEGLEEQNEPPKPDNKGESKFTGIIKNLKIQ